MDKKKLKQRRQESLKTIFFYYIFIMFIIVLLLSGITVKICTMAYNHIITSHAYIQQPLSSITRDTAFYSYGYIIEENTSRDTQKNNENVFTSHEKFLCNILQALSITLPFLFLCIGIWITGSIFYSRRLKKPFGLLNHGISHIKQNDLDFSLEYSGKDELGDLCEAFEAMRQAILKNNIEMWNMVDEKKKLNASLAHDLRTPITIIKGYSEYILHNLKYNSISQETIKEILSYIQNAASRLESYADSVHHIHILEHLELEYNNTNLSSLSSEITSVFTLIAKNFHKKIHISSELPNQDIFISTVAVFRILENIVRNACYYSKENIFITLSLEKEYFTITVIDDGNGFSETSIQKAFRPYYKEGGKENHYGMGLTICKILSKKHEGDIFLSNMTSHNKKGAKVVVTLKIKQKNF